LNDKITPLNPSRSLTLTEEVFFKNIAISVQKFLWRIPLVNISNLTNTLYQCRQLLDESLNCRYKTKKTSGTARFGLMLLILKELCNYDEKILQDIMFSGRLEKANKTTFIRSMELCFLSNVVFRAV
jgi:hypothetical protein